ncbi:uncharacterized protein [Antedon mediterranea]|uniref:uncharacterized protein n=1 Tax=Antedon mediterranea TaxID=105859 RepID=UPI003AF6E6C5
MFANGRGRISLRVQNPVGSDSGTYNCNIEGSSQQHPVRNSLSVYWIKMVNPEYLARHGIDNFEMKCRYGPEDMQLTGYKWKKIKEDGTTEIEDCSKDPNFEVKCYQNSILSLKKISNFVIGDTGKYHCEIHPIAEEKSLKASTKLTVVAKDPVLTIEKSIMCLAENAIIPFRMLSIPQNINEFIFEKLESGKWKKVGSSKCSGRLCVHYDTVTLEGYLTIPTVEHSDAGEYRLKCVTDENDIVYLANCNLDLAYMDDCFATLGENAVLTYKYESDKDIVVRWYKKTFDGNTLILSSSESRIKQVEGANKGTIGLNETRLEFKKVVLTDAGVYICNLRKKNIPHEITANLYAPWDVFTDNIESGNIYRQPAVIFMKTNCLVFCEQNNSVVMRLGEIIEEGRIQWQHPQVILKEHDASIHNLVPLVIDMEDEKAMLMCISQDNKTKERKIKRMITNDCGKRWKGPNDVKVDLTGIYTLTKCVCVNSNELVVACWKLENNEKKVFVMKSTDDGRTWNIVTGFKSLDSTLGNHTQVVKYEIKNKEVIYFICSLNDCTQCISNEGSGQFDARSEDPSEANPECLLCIPNNITGGIVRIPKKTDGFYQIAMTSLGNKTTEKCLSLYLSKDGCENWSQFCPLGLVNAEESDLAYVTTLMEEVGIVFVYRYGSETKGYNIGLQMISA